MSIIPSDVKITPWLEQYKAFKEEYPDALLLFRMGDFYEMFFDDAKQAASALNIALTARDPEKKIPMAGIPHHALNSYLARLIRAGYRAAICEQIGEPSTSTKSIVERRVIRVVTPGTYLPDDEAGESAHLASVWPVRGRIAMALLSVNTGLLEAGTLSERDAEAMLSAFAPGEILYPSNIKTLPEFLKGYNLRPVSPETFKPENASGRLKSALHTSRLEGFGIKDGDLCTGPAWAALDYLTATQFSSLNDVLKLSPLLIKDRMSLDSSAQRNLELIPETSGTSVSLLSSIDKCRTSTGRRTLKDWILRPLMDVKAISQRQEYIGVLVSSPSERSQLQDYLSATRDIERSLSRLALGTGNPTDLGAIRDTLRIIPAIKSIRLNNPLKGLQESLPDVSALSEYLESALEERLPRQLGGTWAVIRSSFSRELSSLREFSQKGEEWLSEYVERERENTKTPKLKSGYTNAYGYYLESGKLGLIFQPDYFKQIQTLVSARRYITPELKNFESRMKNAEAEISRIESELYRAVIAHVLEHSKELQLTARLLGILDCTASSAEIARAGNYCCPSVDDSDVISVKGGRHPVIERELKDAGFVPNDVNIDRESRVIILTGPNMAGKSTWLRMTALIVIMSQAGLWVPADSARVGLVDRVFTRIGARDDLVRGSSTFMIEMLETANILNNVTDRSLIILDEVGRGTATYDGMSIAWAVLEYLQGASKSRVLFATHYHELTCLEERLEGVKNYSMTVSEGKDGILFLHQVVRGAAGRSYGIEVARIAGLPDVVLRRAFELLEIYEKNSGGSVNVKDIPAPLPQIALRRQIMLLSPESDAVVEELAGLDTDNITPIEALKILHRLKEKSRNARMA